MFGGSGKPKVLFLCTGNSARSQMGEALLRYHAGDYFEVYSAGLEPKGINPYTVRVLDEMGIDLSGHTSKDVRVYLGHVNFGYLITVCAHAEENCPTTFLGVSHREHWPFDDPAAFQGSDAATLAEFRRVRDEINARIVAWLAEMGVPDAAARIA
jgi:arsenate reductase